MFGGILQATLWLLSTSLDPVELRCQASKRSGTCFYWCAETVLNHGHRCGPDGYPLAYGTRYTQRFASWAAPRLSTQGQRWARETDYCLQREVAELIAPTTSCASFASAAFASHATCYVRHGFCELPWGDYWIIRRTIGNDEFEIPAALSSVAQTANACAQIATSSTRRWWMRRLEKTALRRLKRLQIRLANRQRKSAPAYSNG